MWILVVEAMGALSLLLFIVWWTLGPTHRRERETLRRLAEEDAGPKTNDVNPVAPVADRGPPGSS